ncbi:putative enoyl CoA hydratase [Coemansia sp. 'formosensis']|nr:putative enoyl CoA hydratase [Coemansia sp. 'formosensis']
MPNYKFECLNVSVSGEGVARVEINRPEALNAFNTQTWTEIGQCFTQFKSDGDVRSVVLCAAGRMFTAGLDLKEAMASSLGKAREPDSDVDVARKGYYHRLFILDFQSAISAVEVCDKPVVVVVQGGCLGIGMDLISACDVRIATEDAYFVVKEVDIGMAADVGTLQRLPKIVGNDSWVREVCYTARRVGSKEAHLVGLVSSVYATTGEAMKAAEDMAGVIAAKSPVAVVGTKHLLNYSRDHSVGEGLEYTALWNTLAHNSHDMATAIVSSLKKQAAQFPKL